MLKLEDIKPNSSIRGILPDCLVTTVSVQWYGSDALEIVYRDPAGHIDSEIIYRSDESRLEIVTVGRPWSFDGDGYLFRLVSEAYRIRLAHLFDPLLAVHTSDVQPLPHQITAVYESMLSRQPLRFLLADDPGAGKTIMAGLFIKELIARGDLKRCLIVCPGSLAEQWQDELYKRFHLPFEIMTKDNFEAARTGNWFLENNLVIARLDKLSRNENVQEKLKTNDCRWDLVVCDEAHKLSATFFSGEIKYTKRYKLGQLLSTLTRHFLLMTATPHNGKEEDFQLFLALLDGDRFEGKFRDGVHSCDVSDLMRRMVKENLLTFEGKRLFPERKANTVPYKLSDLEALLYKEVTEYVREEFNRAEKLQNNKRSGTIGFALTILQRRLASSPEAIYQSVFRRKKRLESRLRELELLQRGNELNENINDESLFLEDDDFDDLEDSPSDEIENVENQILDQATAARTIEELKAEIDTLIHLESLCLQVRNSGEDRKWLELKNLLDEIFVNNNQSTRKIVIFTEYRDTLAYLEKRITKFLGRQKAVVCIQGGMGREDRLKTQESFKHDPQALILIATDAAGEGINLQRAHLMVNYDLPWNPNRLEQRFGRIHRIGQTEVCHLWNLVADETREGDVYRLLLDKLEQARMALGGQVFDVLGKLQFDGKPLRNLLIEAIRYGDQPDIKNKLNQVIANAVDQPKIQNLIEDKALVHDSMDTSRIAKVRVEMERAEARRLQPHFIETFFLEAFKQLGGKLRQRENRRYQISNVPGIIRNRDRTIGTGELLLQRYERIVFEKDLVTFQDKPPAAFVCPGHSLLDSAIDIILERNRDLLKRGTVLVDEQDNGIMPRVLFYLEHEVRDATTTRYGNRHTISKQILYVELNSDGNEKHLFYAPYLDFRPLNDDEPDIQVILECEECVWITHELEKKAISHAITKIAPSHIDEVRTRRLTLIDKTRAAVKERLTKEILYWDHRAGDLQLQENTGIANTRLNSQEARKRADELQGRLQKRMEELDLESKISASAPSVLGGLVIIPIGLIAKLSGNVVVSPSTPIDTQISAAKARKIIMEIERKLGFSPTDREYEKLGYDIESADPKTGKLRFIEVKGRISGASTITVTKNEILYSLNKPDNFILAIVEFFDDNSHKVHYVRQPFQREPDFGVTSVNYNFSELIARGEKPR